MEKCIFCGSTRRSAPNLRFFGIPKDPGLKRIQWLYVLGDRNIGPKHRVCANHFRSGRPNSDPSHEDFVPHLYLDEEPDYLEYLESLDDCNEPSNARKRPMKPTILRKRNRQKGVASTANNVPSAGGESSSNGTRLLLIPKNIVDSLALQQGQKVVIKRYKAATNQQH